MTNLAMDVELLFEKGQRLFIERIDISGNTATLDGVVRRQFFILEAILLTRENKGCRK